MSRELTKAQRSVFESAKRVAKANVLAKAQEKCMSSKVVKGNTFLPLRIRRVKNGVLPFETLVSKYGYSNIAIKEGDEEWETQYLISTKLGVIGYGEVLKYDQELSRFTPRILDLDKMSLRVLPMFTGIESVIKDVVLLDQYETFQYVDNPDYDEYEYQDGVQIRELLVIYTYKAIFGSREIVYKTVGRNGKPFDFKLLRVHVAEVDARNKSIADYNSLKNRLERYEDTLNRQSDEDIGIGDGSYEPLRVVLR